VHSALPLISFVVIAVAFDEGCVTVSVETWVFLVLLLSSLQKSFFFTEVNYRTYYNKNVKMILN